MKAIHTLILAVLFTATANFAQSTELKLTAGPGYPNPADTDASCFMVRNNINAVMLQIDEYGRFLVGGNYDGGPSAVPIAEGAGTRLMWYPDKACFRAGRVDGTQWDGVNIGSFSCAFGNNTRASGDNSFAAGNNSIAANLSTFAFGDNCTASGAASVALGYNAHTNARQGSFVFADRSSINLFYAHANHTMNARCSGGFWFYTSSDLSTGISMGAGASSWASVSDSTRKMNFVKSDGEYFLNSLSKLKLGSWNYKTQDPQEFRHYGPMAQEIFRYFGKDKYGTIGNDTTLSSADMDGIMMICLQALENRTEELQNVSGKLSELEKTNRQMALENASQRKLINELLSRFEKVESKLKEFEDNTPRAKFINASADNQGVNK